MLLNLKFLHRAFLKLDPRVEAFNHFYSDFISSNLSLFSKTYHQTDFPSYNLMGRREYEWVRDFASRAHGQIVEFGCGLSPIADCFVDIKPDSNYLGIDFSQSALNEMRRVFPQHSWVLAHLNIFKADQVDFGFCLDASYTQAQVTRMVKSCNISCLFARIQKPGSSLQQIKGYTRSEMDFTEDYRLLIIDWLEFLETLSTPSKENSIAYTAIKKEMTRHNDELEKNNTKRIVTIYEKNT